RGRPCRAAGRWRRVWSRRRGRWGPGAWRPSVAAPAARAAAGAAPPAAGGGGAAVGAGEREGRDLLLDLLGRAGGTRRRLVPRPHQPLQQPAAPEAAVFVD